MRSFIGLEIDETLKEEIASTTLSLKNKIDSARWVKRENLHLTLKFLGEIDAAILDELIPSISKALESQGSFEISLSRFGAFPNLKSARNLWVGIDKGRDEIKELAKRIDLITSDFWPSDKEAFAPHITVLRLKHQSDLSKSIDPKDDQILGRHIERINFVNIYESKLVPNGPIYEKIVEIPLAIDNRT